MPIIIPPELVALLRDGLYFDLHGQLDKAGAAVEPRARGDDVRARIGGCFARANGARALLDVVGWVEPVRVPSAVEVDVRVHGEALVRALQTRVEVERDASRDLHGSAGDRARAGARAGKLTDLLARAQEAGAGERRLTPEEFEQHFGHLPVDGEG
jgi:hypothetical protein